MKCVIPGANLKVFARAIHSLSKIGDEVYIEALSDGLALRTVNSSRSAYACFIFVPTFFTKYDGPSNPQKSADDSDVLKCKITMKSCLTVFKSLSTLEKTVEKCRLSLDLEANRLIFQLCCKHGIVKTYNLAFIECETLQAVFSKDFSPNVLTSQSKLFHDVVGNFQSGQEEITLIVNPEKVTIKNYVDDEPDPNKVIRTELSLMPEEFENYRVGVDTDVTFCLKELRALLAFSEPTNLPLSMYFESAGRPIILAIDSDPSFEANFVLATLADPGTQISSSQQSTSATGHQSNKRTTSKKPAKSGSVSKGQSSSVRKPPTVELKAKKDNTLVPGKDSNSFRQMPSESNGRTTNAVASTSSRAQRSFNDVEDIEIDDVSTTVIESHRMDTTENFASKSSSKGHVETKMSASEKPTASIAEEGCTIQVNKSSEYDASPVIPVMQTTSEKVLQFPSQAQQTKLLCSNASESEEDDEEDEDLVPGTPPSKKFRSLFFGLSQSTTGGSQPTQPPPVVLAEDSEED